jgi:hypothetical protein
LNVSACNKNISFVGFDLGYNLPFLNIATSNQMPIIAAAKNKIIPISDIPNTSGGVSEITMRADPMISAAIMIENDRRLLI